MKFARSLVASLVVVLLAVTVGRTDEKEEKVPLDKLPKAVVDAVKAKFAGADLVSAEKEKEDGKIVYEVNIKFKGSTIEVTVTPEGIILTAEKTIKAKALPRAVSDALEAMYPKASVKKAEEISKEDKITAYEVLIVTADKKTVEVEFDPAGKVIKEEKKDTKDDK